ncbi:MAG TPA: hypothetical protein VEA69_11940 [Tepidisphaeraceae bacterium]|nr:hypothetical protein [Tepidisphaeraceae bacterium]
MGQFRKSSGTRNEFFRKRHRFEHWYRDSTVYFITSKVRDGAHRFLTEPAKAAFWGRFNHYTSAHNFVPWVTTLLSNHYHTLGYLKVGKNLGPMMRKLHGSVAWLTMEATGVKHVPFWRGRGEARLL